MVDRQRLWHSNIEASPRYSPILQCLDQIVLNNRLSSSSVDENRCLLHLSELVASEVPSCLVVQGEHGDDIVAGPQQLLLRHISAAKFVCFLLLVRPRVQHVTSKRFQSACNGLSNPATSDDSNGRAVYIFPAHPEGVPCPPRSIPDRLQSLLNLPCCHQHQSHGRIRSSLSQAVRCITEQDVCSRESLYIDMIVPDTHG
mmetsp:Transcript_28551/g.92133  ORF Transcript_28551/g.92133 Transcript_28551/m.92133 type:complete len:200 (-) Transcript_28551:332-931(-)